MPPRQIEIPRPRLARAFNLALAAALALGLSALVLAPGLAGPQPGLCAAPPAGGPAACGP